MTVALSMAELASAAPTSGGLYYWTFKFSSDRYQRVLSWIVGCGSLEIQPGLSTYRSALLDSNCAGYTAGLAGSEYATSLQIFAATTIGSGGRFIPTKGQI